MPSNQVVLRVLAVTFGLVMACGPADKSGGPGGGGGDGGGGGGNRDGGLGGGDGGGGSGMGTVPVGGACEFTVECVPGATCYEGVCVGEGLLRFSMSWLEDTDIDLHVVTPAGNEIYWLSTLADGGELDVDDCVDGACADPSATHVENVVFTTADPGLYTYWAHNFDGIVNTQVTIEAFVGGVPDTHVETVSASGDGEGTHHTITY